MTRYLCYKHLAQEFDKRPGAWTADELWLIVPEMACEVCYPMLVDNPVLGTLIRLEDASVQFALQHALHETPHLSRLVEALVQARAIIAKAKEETK